MKTPSTPHGLLPALEFLQTRLQADTGRTVALQCSRISADKTTETIIDFGDGRRVFVALHGYKWYHGEEMEPGQLVSVQVQINPTLTKGRHTINWGFEELKVSGLYKDEHENRFPWSWAYEYFGGQSLIWLEYERRRLCEDAHARAVSSMNSALRHASKPSYMPD